MVAVVHGRAGHSLTQAPIEGAEGHSRRGAFFERVVGNAIERWLNNRGDTVHVFHDLVDFHDVQDIDSDRQLVALDLGRSNIDHLVVTGGGWIMIDAKGCGAGTLGTDGKGKGILIDHSGRIRPQPWMDNLHSYARAGIVTRLTGRKGSPAWVFPDETKLDQSVAKARFAEYGATLLTVSELSEGAIDDVVPFPAPDLPLTVIARLQKHLSVLPSE